MMVLNKGLTLHGFMFLPPRRFLSETYVGAAGDLFPAARPLTNSELKREGRDFPPRLHAYVLSLGGKSVPWFFVNNLAARKHHPRCHFTKFSPFISRVWGQVSRAVVGFLF